MFFLPSQYEAVAVIFFQKHFEKDLSLDTYLTPKNTQTSTTREIFLMFSYTGVNTTSSMKKLLQQMGNAWKGAILLGHLREPGKF